MKVVAIKEAKAKLSGYCAEAQQQRILITKHGKPLALMVGVEGQDLEHVMTAANPAFWKLVEKRRQEPAISAAQMRRRLSKPKTRRRRT